MKQSENSKRPKGANRHFNNKEKQQRGKRKKLKSDVHNSVAALEAPVGPLEVQCEALDWEELLVSAHPERQRGDLQQLSAQPVGSHGGVGFLVFGGSLRGVSSCTVKFTSMTPKIKKEIMIPSTFMHCRLRH